MRYGQREGLPREREFYETYTDQSGELKRLFYMRDSGGFEFVERTRDYYFEGVQLIYKKSSVGFTVPRALVPPPDKHYYFYKGNVLAYTDARSTKGNKILVPLIPTPGPDHQKQLQTDLEQLKTAKPD